MEISYILGNETFQPKITKIKKIEPEKISYTLISRNFCDFLKGKLFWKNYGKCEKT